LAKKLSLILFSGDYDKALAALILANSAREINLEVSIFFSFWGLCLVRDPEKINDEDKNAYEKLFSMVTPKGPMELPLSKMNIVGLGKKMMLDMMENDNVPPLSAFLKGAIKKGVNFYGCKLSVEVMGFNEDEFIKELKIIEAKDYLLDALESDIQLFI
jgi:peroxiredoxin family protein